MPKVKVTTIPAGLRFHIWGVALVFLVSLLSPAHATQHKRAGEQPSRLSRQTWRFAVSGDSRNCGDMVMPGIAAGVIRDQAIFYWHLGDLRWISGVDQDFKQLSGNKWNPFDIVYYERHA